MSVVEKKSMGGEPGFWPLVRPHRQFVITSWCNPFGSTRVVCDLHRTRWSDWFVQCYRWCREENQQPALPNIPHYRRLARTYSPHSMGNPRLNGLWFQRIETPSSWLRTPPRSKWCCSTMETLLSYYLDLPLETYMCFLNSVDHTHACTTG